MATTTAEGIQHNKERKQKVATAFIQITEAIAESMYDFIVTFIAMLTALIAVYAAANGIALLASVGMFVIISVYMILLIIRILRRLDESSTNDELAAMLVEMRETLNRIERNV